MKTCLKNPFLLPVLVAALERESLPLFGWLLLASAVSVQAQFNYTITNQTVTITGYTGTNTAVVIPDTITGLPVRSIGDEAFIQSSITDITIPNSVTNIDHRAFVYCTSLTAISVEANNPEYSSVGGVLFNQSQTTLIQYPVGKVGSYSIPTGVTNIGDLAFWDCSSVTTVTIPNTVTSIGQGAFYSCTSLTNVTIPNSITRIGDEAFLYCTSLTNVTIPNSVTYIGAMGFSRCTSLASVTIPNSVTKIGDLAFSDCSSLTAISVETNHPAYSSVSGVLFNQSQTTLIEYPGGKVGSYSIPKSVTSIGDLAFWDCSSLTTVTIPNTVTSIGTDAFEGCSGLTSVTIPNSVTSIGFGAFSYCANLTAISVETNHPAYSSVSGVLFNQSQTTLIEYPGGKVGSYSIPKSVTSIGDGAFFGDIGLTSVTIPNSVTSIREDAFNACTNLTSVTIPNSVASIGYGAFGSCANLTGVYFQGNAPSGDSSVFFFDNNATAYYLPGTTGWGSTFGGIPTALWSLPYPLILNSSLGVRSNQFGFTVSWATNLSVVVEASTDLPNPNWSPVTTNVLSGGIFNFSDPQWTNYPSRFYRVRSP